MTFPIYFIAVESPWRFFCSLVQFWFNHMGVLAVKAVLPEFFMDKWTKNVFLLHCPWVIHWHRTTVPSTWTELVAHHFYMEKSRKEISALCWPIHAEQNSLRPKSCVWVVPGKNYSQPVICCSTLGLCNSLKWPGKNFIDFLGSHSGWLNLDALMVDV